ncbi:hypothetical protein CFH99_07875 [Nocardioides aromaticivorans]|uniref:Uncharacterized protein n=1 Tax=Nocardioides aromaticivorans TaxID=200618 RepID=A0ABX7PI59_9ACTN|nr:hypothetical protein [Nocardioides aromaticivorans]QSR25539.1 hypothetical protein CFH99_07875 [Nocardioides aromaticivorans]
MSDFQAQAWICPQCFDDHAGRDCKPDDLKAEIANLRAQVERLHFDLDREAHARQAAESALAAVATREFAERYLAEWVKPYFGPDATDAVACVQRALTAALATPTTPEPEPRAPERVEYAVEWMSNGPHPTRWVGQWSTFDSLEDAQRLAGYTHVHHPKILRRVTTATPWGPVEESQP